MKSHFKNNFYITIILLLALLFSTPLFSQKYTAEFLNIGVGARALAMGGSYVAIASDASAVYWNPAGIAQLASAEISLMHSSQFSDLLQANFANFVYPTKSGIAIGISYFRAGVEDIPMATRLDENNRPIIEKYFQDLEHALFLTFANQVTERFFIGGNLKTIYQQVASHSALGFGFDLGALYRFHSRWTLGICLQDITGTFLFWDTGTREIKYPDLLTGISYQTQVPLVGGTARISLGQTLRFEGKMTENLYSLGNFAGAELNVGLEYEIFSILAVRLGSDGNHLTSGAGLAFSKFSIDYAFVSFDLGNVHRISGNIYF